MHHPVYNPIFREACGVDADEAAIIEQVARAEEPTLDHLSEAQLGRLARSAQSELALLRRDFPQYVALYEKQAGVAV